MRSAAIMLVGVLAIVVPSRAFATDWYVRPASTGSGDGSSWANAWSVTTLNSSWSRVVAGDTVWLAGGAYTTGVRVGTSGAAGRPVTIRPGRDAGSDGLVSFDGVGIDLTGRSYVIVDGERAGTSAIRIANVDTGIGGGSNANMVRYVDMDEVGMGVNLAGTGNEVAYCSLTNVNGGSGTYGAIRVSGGAARFDANVVHHNRIGIITNPGNGYGADGIQTSSGISIHHNTFTVATATRSLPTPEHPDYLQAGGSNFMKVYSNDFIDIGDSAVQLGVWFDHHLQDVWIYNNVFRIVHEHDPWPEYIRLYANGGGHLTGVDNLKILNNLFVDNSDKYNPIRLNGYQTNPTGTGNEIKNNIFLNMGTAPGTALILIEPSTAWAPDAFTFANNVYFGPHGLPHIAFWGHDYALAEWRTAHEPTAITDAPQMVRYAINAADNDFHLTAADTAARDRGVTLTYFTTDRDEVGRPQGTAWDVGPYEYCAGAACGTPPPAPDAGVGGPDAGPGGGSDRDSGVVGIDSGLPAGGCDLSVPVTTGATPLTLACEGTYKLIGNVLGPDDGNNGFFVGIDSDPTGITSEIWDFDVSTTFGEQEVSWRGTCDFSCAEFDPKLFDLTAGAHTLYVQLRPDEPRAQIDRIRLVRLSGAPVDAGAGPGPGAGPDAGVGAGGRDASTVHADAARPGHVTGAAPSGCAVSAHRAGPAAGSVLGLALAALAAFTHGRRRGRPKAGEAGK